jgi:repressor LexA
MHCAGTPKPVYDGVRFLAHAPTYAIIAQVKQAELCDLSNCDHRMVSQSHGMDPEEILQLLDARGMSQSELARRIELDQDKLNKALRGKRRISLKEMEAIKKVLFHEHAQPIRSIPVIGQISAGNWREAIQHPIDAVPMADSSIPPRAFGLRVNGDSMDLLVDDGALIIVDPDDRVLFNDRYYAVLNADGEATFKQFKTDPARLVPCSTNPAHREIVLGDEFYEVIGRIIWRAARM